METRLRVSISGSAFSALIRFGNRVLLRAQCGLLPGPYLLSSNKCKVDLLSLEMFLSHTQLPSQNWPKPLLKQEQISVPNGYRQWKRSRMNYLRNVWTWRHVISLSWLLTPQVPVGDKKTTYSEYAKIDANYRPLVCRTQHLSLVPQLCVFMTDHIDLTPYSIGFQKCINVECCNSKRASVQFRELAMQRHFVPCLDPDHNGHFLLRSDALESVCDAGWDRRNSWRGTCVNRWWLVQEWWKYVRILLFRVRPR